MQALNHADLLRYLTLQIYATLASSARLLWFESPNVQKLMYVFNI